MAIKIKYFLKGIKFSYDAIVILIAISAVKKNIELEQSMNYGKGVNPYGNKNTKRYLRLWRFTYLDKVSQQLNSILEAHPDVDDIPVSLIKYAISLNDISMIDDYRNGEPVFYRDSRTKQPTSVGWILK